MIHWLKALFSTIKVDNPDDYVPYTEMFTPNFLADVYVKFQEHINQNEPVITFPELIRTTMFDSPEWINCKKRMINLKCPYNDVESSNFIEAICYNTWFFNMQMAGHQFTANEKSALAGFVFYRDNCDEADYPLRNVDESVDEMRKNSHERFIEHVFVANLKQLTAYNEKFHTRECPA